MSKEEMQLLGLLVIALGVVVGWYMASKITNRDPNVIALRKLQEDLKKQKSKPSVVATLDPLGKMVLCGDSPVVKGRVRSFSSLYGNAIVVYLTMAESTVRKIDWPDDDIPFKPEHDVDYLVTLNNGERVVFRYYLGCWHVIHYKPQGQTFPDRPSLRATGA